MIASVLTLVALLQANEPGPSSLEASAPATVEPSKTQRFGLGASAGMLANKYGAAALVRVSGEVTLFSRPLNDFVALVQVGSAVGVVLPSDGDFREHYQHTAVAGFGYRSNHELLSWGFQLGLGAAWYRASFFPGTFPFDTWVSAYVEGRVQLGIKLAPNFRSGLFVGYGSLLRYPWYGVHQGSWFVGGGLFGLYADWR